jgi:hypothetical protein
MGRDRLRRRLKESRLQAGEVAGIPLTTADDVTVSVMWNHAPLGDAVLGFAIAANGLVSMLYRPGDELSWTSWTLGQIDDDGHFEVSFIPNQQQKWEARSL